jgi:alpha-galactosidase
VELKTEASSEQLSFTLASPSQALTHVHVRWKAAVAQELVCLGDAWERSYGDLAWRTRVPERVMPWYFITFDGSATHGYGVRTGANALCFWQLDGEGVSLWMNVANGGNGVLLGERVLQAATIVTRRGQPGEDSLAAVGDLCRRMCAKPRPSPGTIYGSNDWYYAYGNSSPERILQDADLVASLRPAKAPAPFTVIDEGWENTAKFPDMSRLAAQIKQRQVRPGIWLRPLRAPANTAAAWLMPAQRFGERTSRAAELAYDPTHPQAREAVTARVRQIHGWGYEMLKHDFSTYDLLGQWGFEMGAQPTLPGWSFHDRSKTNAEIIAALYRDLRGAAGDTMLILGCNTIGHLGAGIFDLQRTGDDTSGKQWERTRRMGVNTLAFRLPQQGTFFTVDPDCVAITESVDWQHTRQWLELVAGSRTSLFVSVATEALGPEQRSALGRAFALMQSNAAGLQPLDWRESTTPERWVDGSNRAESRFTWCEPEGAYPFSI